MVREDLKEQSRGDIKLEEKWHVRGNPPYH